MLTFEKVLGAFSDYLNEDNRYEVVTTSHGYTVMEWDSTMGDWAETWFCPTPEKMNEILRDAMAGYLEYKSTHCRRALTEAEQRDIQTKLQALSNKLQ